MSESAKQWLTLLMVGALAAVVLAPLQAMPYGRDQAAFAVGARDGVFLPFNHSVNAKIYPPGVFGWFTAVRALVGRMETDARQVEWAWMLLTCLLAALVATEWARHKAAGLVAGAVLAVAYLGRGFTGTLQPAGLAQLFLLFALGAWGRPDRERSPRRIIATGLALGAASLFVAGYGIAFFALMVSESYQKQNETSKSFSSVGGRFLLLAFTMALPVLLFAVTRIYPRILTIYFLHPMVRGWLDISTAPSIETLVFLGVIAFLLFAGYRVRRDRPEVLLLGVLCAGWYVYAGFGGDRIMTILGPLAVGAGVAAVELLRRLKAKNLSQNVVRFAAAGLALAVLATTPWLTAARQWRPFLDFLDGRYATEVARYFVDGETRFHYAAVREVAGTLESRSREGDTLLVYGNEPGLYYYSGLPPGMGAGENSADWVVLTPPAEAHSKDGYRLVRRLYGYVVFQRETLVKSPQNADND